LYTRHTFGENDLRNYKFLYFKNKNLKSQNYERLTIHKNRFGIIGNFPALNRAIEKAVQVAPTDISVLVIGESGVGKEHIPKIIHANLEENINLILL
jgi:transcriptional regulator with PAS, ATPase and Fis domain